MTLTALISPCAVETGFYPGAAAQKPMVKCYVSGIVCITAKMMLIMIDNEKTTQHAGEEAKCNAADKQQQITWMG